MNMIMDTHVHIWDLDRGSYKWLEEDTSILKRSYDFEQLLPQLQVSGITDCILVQADNNLGDTERMLETAYMHDQVVGVVGWLPLTHPEETHALLQGKLRKEIYFKGVRHLIHNESDAKWLLQESVLESLRMLADRQLPFDVVGTTNAHLETVLEVAHRIPELQMVLDHLNQPPIAARERFGKWGELMKEVAQHNNIHGKISGLGTASGKAGMQTKTAIKPYVLYVLEVFGSERCFCGGDWPVSLLAGSYQDTWRAYREIIKEELSADEQQRVFYQNAKSFYKV